MKHINITNWQGNITDWTKFNYIYGGLDDTLADRVNLRIPGTNLRNYIKKSDNLIQLRDTPQADYYGLNYKIENGVITVWGTATQSVNMWLSINAVLPENTQYYVNFFHSGEHEGKVIYNIAKRRSDWTNRVYTENPSFTFQKDYSMSAICLQFDANKQYNCTFKPMIVYGNVMPTTYEPYGSMVLVENVDSNLQPLDPPKITVFGSVDLGTLEWAYTALGEPSYFNAHLPNVVNSINVSCPLYKSAWVFSTNTEDKAICTVQNEVRVRDSELEGSIVDLEAKLKGVIFIYEPASQPSANTLSMASPMQLSNDLEETIFNEQIEESVE